MSDALGANWLHCPALIRFCAAAAGVGQTNGRRENDVDDGHDDDDDDNDYDDDDDLDNCNVSLCNSCALMKAR